MLRPLLAIALLSAPGAAYAQQAETGQPPQRIRSVQLTGTDKCPESTAEEVVVCSRLDAGEQFRVPKELRAPPEVPAQNQSWVNRAATVDQVGRVAGGLPNTCSPVGNGGQTGCFNAYGQRWALDRKQREAEATAPGTTTTAADDEGDDEE